MSRKILLVDDEESIQKSLSGALSDEGYQVTPALTGEQAIDTLKTGDFDAMLLDVWLPGIDGLEVLKRARAAHPDIVVVVMSGHGSIETAVKATKLGAYDFVEKPLSLDKLLVTLKNAITFSSLSVENKRLRSAVREHYPMIGNASKMLELKEQVERVAPLDSWVLITGENGTGKELVARAIHEDSQRRHKPFIEVNCAAIPEDLIESELFGHEKGAFTGATQMKRGKFDISDGGTLFLDEIADMSLKTQAKILRILQEQRFERVGGNETNAVDVRVIAATNKDLKTEIAENRFREDLYYRLNVIPIVVPALRARADDIPVLLKYYFDFYSREFKRTNKRLAPDAMVLLQRYRWPGNVRELKNLVERLSIMISDDEIGVKDLPADIRSQIMNESIESSGALFMDMAGVVADGSTSLKEAKNNFERELIIDRLNENSWNVSRTAQSLGIERTNLHRKMKSYNIKALDKD